MALDSPDTQRRNGFGLWGLGLLLILWPLLMLVSDEPWTPGNDRGRGGALIALMDYIHLRFGPKALALFSVLLGTALCLWGRRLLKRSA